MLGSFDFTNTTCTASQQAFFRDAGFIARTVVASPAFEACIRRTIPAEYRRCTSNGRDGDPNATMALHISNALVASRSVNDLKMDCSSGDAWGWAGVGPTPGYYGDERFTYGTTSINRSLEIGRPMCGPGQSFPTHGCREYAYPHGLKEVAATIIHENMHQHGYTHDGCNLADYVPIADSMPWLVDQCLVRIVGESSSACGDICQGRVGDDLTACRARGRLRLVTAPGATSCADAWDPGVSGLGALGVRGRELIALDMLPHDRPFGPSYGSRNRTSDIFRAKGDFNPWQAGEEMLFEHTTSTGLRGGWHAVGWDVSRPTAERTTFSATREFNNRLDTIGAPAGTGRWLLYTDTRILGVGRFSSAAQWGTDRVRDEILVRSPDGLGVLAIAGNFRTRNLMPFGTVLRGAGSATWPVGSSDVILALADLNGDAQTDILVRNATRIAILSRTGSDGSFRVLDVRDIAGPTGFYGYWNIGPFDSVAAVGDFVGDSREEVLMRSPWGIGLLGMPAGSTTLRDLWAAPNGTNVASRWTLESTDRVRFAGRFASSKKSVVLTNGTKGLAVLAWSGTTTVTASVPQLTGASGGYFLHPDSSRRFWAYGTTNQLLAMGDFDGDGRDSLMIKSPWGYGIVGPSVSTSTWFLHDANRTDCGPASEIACNNGLFGSWLARENDRVVTTLRDTRGTADSLILRSRF